MEKNPKVLQPYVQPLLDELEAIMPGILPNWAEYKRSFYLMHSQGPAHLGGQLHEDNRRVAYNLLIPWIGPGTIYAAAGRLFHVGLGQALLITGRGAENVSPADISTLHTAPTRNSGLRLLFSVHLDAR